MASICVSVTNNSYLIELDVIGQADNSGHCTSCFCTMVMSQSEECRTVMDSVEVVSTGEMLKTPAGTIKHCLHLRETTPIESEVSEKYYAPGIGLIKGEEFEPDVMPE